jgi:Flp pilus assembly protein TadD
VENEDPPRDARPTDPSRPRVIVLGWDGADWSLLDRLVAEGRMPHLARLTREGRTARLASFVPLLSPVVWTSAATGLTPDRHGVLDFQEVDPDSGDVVPISGRSRRVPAIWNLASDRGSRVGVVGWWATHPAEEVNGFFVTDRAGAILFEGGQEGMAFPETLAPGVRRVIAEEAEISSADLASFLARDPAALAAELARGGGLESPVAAMAKILSATRSVHRIARELYDRERPDLTIVYYEGTDVIGHVFAPYVAPRLACVSDADFAGYSGTVAAYHAMVDRLLGQWMRRAREDGATLLLVSDHGFKWEEDRSCARSSSNWTTAAFWHRPDGILAAWGARVAPAPERSEASLFDVAPTVAALMGLPVDVRMTGTPLLSLFDGVPRPAREEVFADVSVRRVLSAPASPEQQSEYASKLRALGYLTGSESQRRDRPAEGGGRPGRTEGAWNSLGLFQQGAGQVAAAEKAFREALAMRPDYGPPMFNLAVLERKRGRWDAASDWLFRSLEAGHAEPEETIAQWAALAAASGRRVVAGSLLGRGTSRYPGSETLALALGRHRFEADDCDGAFAALARFAQSQRRDTVNLLGLSQLCRGRLKEARRHLERSLAIDPAQPAIRQALEKIAAAAGR